MKIWFNKLHDSRRSFVEVSSTEVSIGRDATCDVVLPSPLVSRKHAVVRITGDKFKAAVWSARSGQVFGWALVVVAAYLVLVRREYNWLWSALLGWFLISAATAESQQAMLQSRLRTIAVREIRVQLRLVKDEQQAGKGRQMELGKDEELGVRNRVEIAIWAYETRRIPGR